MQVGDQAVDDDRDGDGREDEGAQHGETGRSQPLKARLMTVSVGKTQSQIISGS